jgi:hypothetical protein
MKAIKVGKDFQVYKNGAPTEIALSITKALAEANGKATSHTFNHGFEILELLVMFHIKTTKMLGSEKAKIGAKVILESGGIVPNAYKYSRIGTQVVFEYRYSGWYINSIKTVDLYNKGGCNSIHLTQSQSDLATKIFQQSYKLQ